MQLIPLFWIKDGLTETGTEPLQQFLNDQKRDRVGPFGAGGAAVGEAVCVTQLGNANEIS